MPCPDWLLNTTIHASNSKENHCSHIIIPHFYFSILMAILRPASLFRIIKALAKHVKLLQRPMKGEETSVIYNTSISFAIYNKLVLIAS